MTRIHSRILIYRANGADLKTVAVIFDSRILVNDIKYVLE